VTVTKAAARRAAVAIACVGTASVVPAHSADWSLVPSVDLSERYEQNVGLRAFDAFGSSSTQLGLGLTLRGATESVSYFFEPRLAWQRYASSGDQNLDRDEQRARMGFDHKGELNTAAGELTLTRDSTLTSELGTTGINQFNRRHQELLSSLNYTWRLNERYSLVPAVSYRKSVYLDAADLGLLDFSYASASLSAVAVVAARQTLSLATSAGRMQSDSPSTQNTNVTLQWSWRPAQNWQTSLAAGPSWVKTPNGTDTGTVYSAQLSHSAERSSVSLSASRSISPAGRGVLTQREDVAVSLGRQWRERWNSSLSASVIQTSELISALGFTFGDVRYARAETTTTWRPLQNWSVTLNAGYSRQIYKTAVYNAGGLDGRLALNWSRDLYGN